MPSLNLLTWNSRGESVAKATFLHDLIVNNTVVPGWTPDVIVIQEAMSAPGGALWAMLSNLGTPGTPEFCPAYLGRVPQFAGIPGEGYILMLSAPTSLTTAFAAVDLSVDPGVVSTITNPAFTPGQRADLLAAVTTYRAPAHAQLSRSGRTIELLTWHAPLGPGLPFMLGARASVNYTAYFLLQRSDLYNHTLCHPGAVGANLGLIAGDLNITVQDLMQPTLVPLVPALLPGWRAVSNHLDHVCGRTDNGTAGITFQHAGHYPSPSDHNVLVGTITWP